MLKKMITTEKKIFLIKNIGTVNIVKKELTFLVNRR